MLEDEGIFRPNIWGYISHLFSQQRLTGFSGALAWGHDASYAQTAESRDGSADINLDASHLNSIYGNYSRVQTPAIQSLIAIRYA